MALALILALILLVTIISAQMEKKIVGGDFANITEYPHSASLVIYCETLVDLVVFSCGASILNQDLLLSAGHCFFDCKPSSNVDATVGHENIQKGRSVAVALFVVHEDFAEPSVRNDIALVRLKQTLQFDDTVKRVLLVRQTPYDEPASVAGWGVIHEEDGTRVPLLKCLLNQRLWRRRDCLDVLRAFPEGAFCAGARRGTDYASVGDSGSALVVRGVVQIGVVSYKRPQYSRSLSVYTDVGSHYDWIQEHADKILLIKLSKTADHTLVTKVCSEYASEGDDKYRLDDKKLSEEVKQDLNNTDATIERDKQCIELEREKRITVGRKAKRQPTAKSEVQYEVTEDLKCAECAAVLPNAYVFHAHMNKHFPNHICETCGKGFLTKKRLKRHMPSHIKGPFTCAECDAVFSNYNTLNSHRQRKHKSVLLYACPSCGERFGTLTRRARHLAARHGARAPHRCALCARRFLLAGNLSTHMRNKHFKEKRHFCVECGEGFFHKQELRGHMATHTGANDFQCALCSKSYPRKKALDVHMRGHRDDRRFHCELCGKKFLQKCTLMTHAKTHNRTDEQK